MNEEKDMNKGTPADPLREAALAEGAHVLSEWLNDNAPIGERRYLDALKAAIKAMHALPADAPIRRLF